VCVCGWWDAGTDVLKLLHFESSQSPIKLTCLKAFCYSACNQKTDHAERRQFSVSDHMKITIVTSKLSVIKPTTRDLTIKDTRKKHCVSSLYSALLSLSITIKYANNMQTMQMGCTQGLLHFDNQS
jgi:hypothetical protein